jgi:hypothetical protein
MNYKRKHPSYRKFRHLRRGYGGLGIDKLRKQIDRDHFDKILESIGEYHFSKKSL